MQRGVTLDMTPCLAAFDQADVGLRDPVLPSDSSLRSPVRTNSQNLLSREERLSVLLSIHPRIAALCDHVGVVASKCVKEHVVRIDATPYIAFVANEKAVWNGAVYQFPRRAMRQGRSCSLAVHSVSARVAMRDPKSATASARLAFVSKSLLYAPMTRAQKTFACRFSHGTRFLRCCDQGRVSATTLLGPRILAVAA